MLNKGNVLIFNAKLNDQLSCKSCKTGISLQKITNRQHILSYLKKNRTLNITDPADKS